MLHLTELSHSLESTFLFHGRGDSGSDRFGSGGQPHTWTQTCFIKASQPTRGDRVVLYISVAGSTCSGHRFLGPGPDLRDRKFQQTGLVTCLVTECPRQLDHGHTGVSVTHMPSGKSPSREHFALCWAPSASCCHVSGVTISIISGAGGSIGSFEALVSTAPW